MKNNLGRIFLFLFLSLKLFASSYEWSVEVSKKQAMTNEAIHLKYTCIFSDIAQTHDIEFKAAMENDEYKILLLSENESIIDARKINTYDYLLYVKKAQNFKLTLDTTMKKTNKDSIRNSVIGRDNFASEDYSVRVIRQEGVEIEIVDAVASLVGNISARIKRDEDAVLAYEPYHYEIKIEGLANFEAIEAFEFDIDGVKVIREGAVKNLELTKDGFVGLWSQKFAFVSDKNFTIPSVELKYYDLQEKKLKSFNFDEVDVEVSELYKKEELLDEIEEQFELEYKYIYYLLAFLAGFLFAKIKFKRRVNLSSKEILFNEKIDKTKSLKELHFLLVLNDAKRFSKIIEDIEQKKIKSLKNAKEVSKFKIA